MDSNILRLSFLPIFFPNQLTLLLRSISGFCHSSALAQSANAERYSLCHKIFFDWTCAAPLPPFFFQLQSLFLFFFFSIQSVVQLCLNQICKPKQHKHISPYQLCCTSGWGGVQVLSQEFLVPSVGHSLLRPQAFYLHRDC